jgi:hypothetical protein
LVVRSGASKGLCRWSVGVWISLTVIWLVGYGISAFADQDVGSLTHSCEELRELVDPITGKKTSGGDTDVASCEARWSTKKVKLLEWWLRPPIAVFVVGGLVGWVVSGFRPAKSN